MTKTKRIISLSLLIGGCALTVPFTAGFWFAGHSTAEVKVTRYPSSSGSTGSIVGVGCFNYGTVSFGIDPLNFPESSYAEWSITLHRTALMNEKILLNPSLNEDLATNLRAVIQLDNARQSADIATIACGSFIAIFTIAAFVGMILLAVWLNSKEVENNTTSNKSAKSNLEQTTVS